MYQTHRTRMLTKEIIESYTVALQEDEKSTTTVIKYGYNLNMASELFSVKWNMCKRARKVVQVGR